MKNVLTAEQQAVLDAAIAPLKIKIEQLGREIAEGSAREEADRVFEQQIFDAACRAGVAGPRDRFLMNLNTIIRHAHRVFVRTMDRPPVTFRMEVPGVPLGPSEWIHLFRNDPAAAGLLVPVEGSRSQEAA